VTVIACASQLVNRETDPTKPTDSKDCSSSNAFSFRREPPPPESRLRSFGGPWARRIGAQ